MLLGVREPIVKKAGPRFTELRSLNAFSSEDWIDALSTLWVDNPSREPLSNLETIKQILQTRNGKRTILTGLSFESVLRYSRVLELGAINPLPAWDNWPKRNASGTAQLDTFTEQILLLHQEESGRCEFITLRVEWELCEPFLKAKQARFEGIRLEVFFSRMDARKTALMIGIFENLTWLQFYNVLSLSQRYARSFKENPYIVSYCRESYIRARSKWYELESFLIRIKSLFLFRT